MNEWQRALESLTPGGSEFCGDAEACLAHVRQRLDTSHERGKKIVRLRRVMRQANVDLATVWKIAAQIKSTPIRERVQEIRWNLKEAIDPPKGE